MGFRLLDLHSLKWMTSKITLPAYANIYISGGKKCKGHLRWCCSRERSVCRQVTCAAAADSVFIPGRSDWSTCTRLFKFRSVPDLPQFSLGSVQRMFDLRVQLYQLFDKTLIRNRPVQYGCTGSVVLVCMIAKHPRTAICSLVAVAMVTAWLLIRCCSVAWGNKSLTLSGWPACNVWISLLAFKSLGRWDLF